MLQDLHNLRDFINRARNLVVLTGAGCSTESGIPDYRGPSGAWRHRKPMQIGEFLRSDVNRRRYWARSYFGWPRFAAARPNAAHRALAALESGGPVAAVITQNVDGLHSSAGSRSVIDLHGRLDRVVCLSCESTISRDALQERLARLNRGWNPGGNVAPDGDAEIGQEWIDRFAVAACGCGGVLKPDVVFFGENVPVDRVAESMRALATADALLVVGSSLAVWSGFRFARAAADRGLPIAIVNVGWTRADDLAALKVEQRCGDLLRALVSSTEPSALT